MMADQQGIGTEGDDEQDDTPDGPLVREPAWRVFAAEFNDATHETKDGGERAPSYVVTPLGARINRMLVVGVLTSNEPTGEGGSMRRAQITDPTGVFHIYAGQYQPEALQVLEEVEPPQIVAVVGKARTYSPEEGTVYTSIRPEVIHPVSSDERDAWILEAAEQTLERIDALNTARGLTDASERGLRHADIPERLVPGIMEAREAYGDTEVDGYLSLIADALGYLLPDPPEPRIVHAGESEADVDTAPTAGTEPETGPETQAKTGTEPEQPAGTGTAEAAEPTSEDAEPPVDAENVVFDLVEELDDGDGAPWERIVEQGSEEGLTEEQIEEAMNLLMDRGRVFEPVLGKLKAT